MPLTVRALLCLVTAALIAVACGPSDDTAAPDRAIPATATFTAQPAATTAPPASAPTATADPTTPAATSTTSPTSIPVQPTPAPTSGLPSATATVIPAATSTSEPTVNQRQSGLGCYGSGLTSWEFSVDKDSAAGFPTLVEAATDWWQNAPEALWWHQNDGTSSISAEDLTQSPPTSPPKGWGSAASGIDPDDQPQRPPTAIYYRDGRENAQIVIYGKQLTDGNWVIYRGESCSYMED